MKKTALITNFNIYEKANAAYSVAQKLSEFVSEVMVPSNYADRISAIKKKHVKYKFVPIAQIYREAECIFVLGGDGTILEIARNAATNGIPVMGINMGRIGYISELEMNELHLLKKFFDGEYNIDERSILSVKFKNSRTGVETEGFALNDVVISKGSVARIIDLELYEKNDLVNSYRADGLIVATPTGSTAYSMSAGGSIADPNLRCILVTPICPHALGTRPIIFNDSACLEIKNVCQREKMLYITLDGKINYEFPGGESVKITRAEITAKFIRVKEKGFYNKLREKIKI